MWRIIVEIAIPKIWSDRVEHVIRREEICSPGGQIPSRARIEAAAQAAAGQFLNRLHETIGARPYDYGRPGGVGIGSVEWVPGGVCDDPI